MKPHLIGAIVGMFAACALFQPPSAAAQSQRLERVIMPLQIVKGMSLVETAKRHLGPSGLMVVVGDHIVLQDTPANVRRISAILTAETMRSQVLTVEHIAASQAKKILDEFFGCKNDRPTVLIVREGPEAVMIAGTREQIDRARSLLTKLDVPRAAARHRQAEAVFKIYTAPDGKAEVLVKFLRDIHGKSPDKKLVALSGNEVLVYGPLDFHMDVAVVLEGARAQRTLEAIPLSTLKAARTAETLQTLFGYKGPLIAADTDRNVLIVRGNRQQVGEVKAALPMLGEDAQSATVVTIAMNKGYAMVLAEELPRLLQARGHAVRLVVPGDHSNSNSKGDFPKAMITLVIVGDRLIATCDDPQGIALVRATVDSQTASRDSEIIRLRHATATEAARVLDKFFNDSESPSRLRIVADPRTNSLLVKGSHLDLLAVKRMIHNELDIGQDKAAANGDIRIYKLRNASAENMARILRDFVRDEKGVTITHDPRTNSVLVRCPRAIEETIAVMISKLDQD